MSQPSARRRGSNNSTNAGARHINNSGGMSNSVCNSASGFNLSTSKGAARSVNTTQAGFTTGQQLESKQQNSSRSPTSGASTIASTTFANSSSSSSQSIKETADEERERERIDSGLVSKTSTSGSHRLSSIEILNENRQRQLQFKQQESFKLHLEQRQKFIQQQQRESNDDSNLGLTYQVNTSAPDFMASALANKNKAAAAAEQTSAPSVGIAVNPFDEERRSAAKRHADFKRPTSAPGANDDKSSTVSGKSGFLSALMDEASFEANQLDRSSEELNNVAAKQLEATRYANVGAQGTRSYNYDEPPDKRPFYQKDLATLLQDCRSSRSLVIAIVAIALLLDNMLLTSVVPIIPFDLLKNRMERKHLELMTTMNKSKAFNASLAGSQQGSTELDQEDLARYIDQSLANAKDRYSGSVLHPRVRVKPAKQKVGPDSRDEDDDDDDNDDGNASSAADEQVSRKVDSSRRMSSERERERKMQRPTLDDYDESGADNDGDDAETTTTTTKQTTESRKNAKTEKGKKKISNKSDSTKKPASKSKSAYDDDDEDSANSQRWLRTKSALMSLAKSNGNDTDALAGKCLNLVLGDDLDDDDDDDDDKDEDDDEIKFKKATTERAPLEVQRKTTNQRKSRQERSPRVEKVKAGPKVIRPTSKPVQSTTSTQSPARAEAEEAQQGNGAGIQLDDMSTVSHQDIVDESFEVGVMFASKPIVQAFANPFIGTLTNKVGFTIPMFTGFVIMFISTLVFAFGSSYSTLFIARAIQGVGSACTSVAGMSMLADRFPDDAERGNAMAIALGGLALGVVIGPPFGGFMYEFVGRSSPFIVLSFLALLDGLLQLLVLQPRVTKSQEEGASLMTLIKDPYILVAAGAITFANTGIAILEPALPLWMMDTMQAKNWEQGVAFLPAALSYMFGTNLFGNLGHKIGRWRSTMFGLIIIGCSLLLIPFATRVDHLIIPNGAIGFAMGMVDSTMMPMLGYLVDIRHTSVYGSVYAIGDVAFCASFAFGPALSGTLVELIGFEGLIITTAMICFCFAPLLLLLKNPPARQLNEAQLQEQSTLRYVNYNHLDSPDEEAHLTDYKTTDKTYVR